jgi:FkbM family methyltransferase
MYPNHPYRVPFDGDLILEIFLSDELASRYALNREFEPEVCAFFRDRLFPGGVVFDVGANIGHFTLLAAKHVGSLGHVHAFEPSPKEFRKLASNVVLNQFANVTLNQTAICDRTGTIAFHLCEDGLGLYNSLAKSIHPTAVTIIVPCTTIDDYVVLHGIRKVDLVKIDVEGAEPMVLRGASTLLSRGDAPIVVCAFADPTLQGGGATSHMLRRAFEEFGYQLYRYDTSARQLIVEPERSWYQYDNLVCAKCAATVP